MFSEVQRNYIQQLVLANKDKYPYYLAYTNTNISGSYNNDDYNFYIILSDQPITATTKYNYTFSGTTLRYGVRSSNASFNYHSERVSTLQNVTAVTVDNFEFVYTNAEFATISLQPDLIASYQVKQSHFDGFSIALLIILTAVIFSKIMRGGGGYAKI